MKKIIIYTIFLFVGIQYGNTQININYNNGDKQQLDLVQLENQKETIKQREKEKLTEEVEEINKQLEKGEITAENAAKLKKNAAEKRAQNIKEQIEVVDANISLLKRNSMKEWDYYSRLEYLFSKNKEEKIDITKATDSTDEDSTSKKKVKRTHIHSLIGWGFNNAIVSGQSFNNSPYKIGRSQYFDIGFEFSTALVKSGFLRVNYGMSFQFNGINPIDNQYFIKDNDDHIVLQEFPTPLKKSKLRIDNIVIPIHFEIGPSNERYYAKKFKAGIGGFAGLNIGDVQKLKYNFEGSQIKVKKKNYYRTSNFVYGLSAYVGYDWITLYARYNINPIFKSNPVEENNIAIGIRCVF